MLRAAVVVVALAALAGVGASEDIPLGFVPISVTPAMSVDSSSVTLCKLDHAARTRDPPAYPMFKYLVSASGCSGTNLRTISLGNLRRLVDSELKTRAGAIDEPSGFVFHQARCGSTLVANMLAGVETNVVYSESSPPADVVMRNNWSDEQSADALRVIMLAMARVPGATRLYFKFQSAMTPYLHLVRKAFPLTPWIFVHRHPVEVMASLLSTVETGMVMSNRNSPCLRTQTSPPAGLLSILGVSASAAAALPGDQYCAAHLAYLDDIALRNLRDAEFKSAARAGRGRGLVVNYATMPNSIVEVTERHFRQTLSPEQRARMLSMAEIYSKSSAAKEEEFQPDSQRKQETAPPSLTKWSDAYVMPRFSELDSFHLARALGDSLSGFVDETKPAKTGSSSSSSASSSSASLRASSSSSGSGSEGVSVPGSVSLAQTRYSSNDRFVDPNMPTPTGGFRPASTVPEAYPRLFPMVEILDNWNADEPRIPRNYGKYSSLRTFDFNDPNDMREALKYRNAEVPFVVRNVTPLLEANRKWTDDYLNYIFGSHKKTVEVADSNHFMYYNRGASTVRTGQYKAITRDTVMTYRDWIAKADEGEMKIIHEGVPNSEAPHYYFRASARQGPGENDNMGGDPGRDNSFIIEDLPIFRNVPSFWIVDPTQQRGIHCRYGMTGILAEDHWDAGRNFIAMARGKKRYLINPPSECPNLDLLFTGPSARHSQTDWSNPDMYRKTLAKAMGLEVVIETGDILYVPSLWFHLPISLTTSIQCNTRSGSAPEGALDIQKCGFDNHVTEQGGVKKPTPVFYTTYPGLPPAPAFPTSPKAVSSYFTSGKGRRLASLEGLMEQTARLGEYASHAFSAASAKVSSGGVASALWAITAGLALVALPVAFLVARRAAALRRTG